MTAAVGTDEFAANLALANLGEPGIAAMSDQTKRARYIRQFFAPARDEILRRKDWNFASAWHIPSADSVPGLGPFKIRYPMPAYCVRVRELQGCENDQWTIESAKADVQGAAVDVEVVVTNITEPVVRITRNDIPVRLWDAIFLPAFSHMLASYLATALGKSKSTKEYHKAEAYRLSADAATIDSKESGRKARQRPETSWVSARRGRGSPSRYPR